MREKHLRGICLTALMVLIVFLNLFSVPVIPEGIREGPSMGATDVELVVVYDNNPYKPGLRTAWGFSCFLTGTEKTILFDGGGEGGVLLHNMEKLGITPKQVDVIVLSHNHGDHTGGLTALLERNGDVIVCLPKSFPEHFKGEVRGHGAQVVEVKDAMEICQHVYSTGELGISTKEQSLIVQTERGLIVVTGCAHPGIAEIVDYVTKLLKDNVLLVTGGFHLGGMDRAKVEKIVSGFKESGIRYVGPCHCSGETARRLFKVAYGKRFLDLGVGRIIRTRDLR